MEETSRLETTYFRGKWFHFAEFPDGENERRVRAFNDLAER